MVGILEAAGWVLVGGCAAQAAASLYGTIQRRFREAEMAAREAQFFERRAEIL